MFSLLNSLRPAPTQSSDPSSPLDSGPGLCINCNFQPQARDPTSGNYYLFCSNACAAPRTLPGMPTNPNPFGGPNMSANFNANPNMLANSAFTMCINCMGRPRYVEGPVVHPYCGRTCANLAKSNGVANMNPPVPINPVNSASPFMNYPTQPIIPANITGYQGFPAANNTTNATGFGNPHPDPTTMQNNINNMPPSYWAPPPPPSCKTPGCFSPVSVKPNGIAGKYCTSHERWDTRGCISCRKAPTNGSTVFCHSCYNNALRSAPMIVEVPTNHERYKSVEKQFEQKWLHSGKPPKVGAIYKIVNTTANMARYEQYRNQVEAKGNFASQNRTPGNENRRWHGTTRRCNIGDKGVTKLCSNSTCFLCCIIKNSFNLSSARSGMFGKGIYTSATSSKSNAYSSNACTSGWKAMLLNTVIVGRGHKLTASNTALTGPPAGFDSVLAEAGAGLNYDELVVYNNDAIRPSYLLMYETPP